MKDPLDGFADRLIRNGEVKEFVKGLAEKGAGNDVFAAVMELRAIIMANGIIREGTELAPGVTATGVKVRHD